MFLLLKDESSCCQRGPQVQQSSRGLAGRAAAHRHRGTSLFVEVRRSTPTMNAASNLGTAGVPPSSGDCMLWTIFAILVLLWLLGWGFHVAGSLIHLVLVIALVVLVIELITGRRVESPTQK